MPNIQPTFLHVGGTISIEASDSAKITNLAVSTSEASHAVTANTKQIIIRARGTDTLQVAFTATESTTKYPTIPKYCNLHLADLDFSGTIYITSDKISGTAEILELY